MFNLEDIQQRTLSIKTTQMSRKSCLVACNTGRTAAHTGGDPGHVLLHHGLPATKPDQLTRFKPRQMIDPVSAFLLYTPVGEPGTSVVIAPATRRLERESHAALPAKGVRKPFEILLHWEH